MNQIELHPKIELTLRGIIMAGVGIGAIALLNLIAGPEPVIWVYVGFVLYSCVILLSTLSWWLLNTRVTWTTEPNQEEQ